jgi:hypothetical protein
VSAAENDLRHGVTDGGHAVLERFEIQTEGWARMGEADLVAEIRLLIGDGPVQPGVWADFEIAKLGALCVQLLDRRFAAQTSDAAVLA